MIEKLLAQSSLGGSISGEGLGRIGAQAIPDGTTALTYITNIISAVIGFMTAAAGIWFLFMIFIGGYTWMSSMGDKQKLEQARDRIVYALVGLVIVVAAWALLALVGLFFGWDSVIKSPQTIIDAITGSMPGNKN
jgi:hypothetical protein